MSELPSSGWRLKRRLNRRECLSVAKPRSWRKRKPPHTNPHSPPPSPASRVPNFRKPAHCNSLRSNERKIAAENVLAVSGKMWKRCPRKSERPKCNSWSKTSSVAYADVSHGSSRNWGRTIAWRSKKGGHVLWLSLGFVVTFNCLNWPWDSNHAFTGALCTVTLHNMPVFFLLDSVSSSHHTFFLVSRETRAKGL